MRCFLYTLCAVALTSPARSQTVQGVIRTAGGQPIAGITVSLRGTSTDPQVKSRTDSKGSYRLHASRGGTYTLHAEAAGYVAASDGPFALGKAESKKLDLSLRPLDAEFFDEPNFIVAGVIDSTNHGGHGPDTVVRSTETLAKATASLGGVGEKPGDALALVRGYQRAAESDPSEQNYFNWGSELLTHRATVPALEVFAKGTRLFPRSTRMMLGLAVSWYTQGSDDKAAQYLFAACDLNPSDPAPYLFLGKVQSAAIIQAPDYLERLQRFAKLQPDNALASYYLAAGLWKNRTDFNDSNQVEALLRKAVRLDPQLSTAYLLLGIIHSERRDSRAAIAFYQQAGGAEAHYRLAQEYRKLGENQSSEKELSLYKELQKKDADQDAGQEVQQFVYSLRGRQ